MQKLTLRADARTETGNKVRALRRRGQVPAVVYGHGIAARSISVANLDFAKVFRAAGESTIVELAVGEAAPVNVLITDMQADPVTGKFTHADFFQVRMDEKIEATVPLEFSGEAPAVKELGGIFLKTIDAVDVKSLPADLPHSIPVDISVLKAFDDHIKVGDLTVSSKVEIMAEPDTIVASVMPPRTEEELSALNEKVEMDVTKVEGVVKEEAPVEEIKSPEA